MKKTAILIVLAVLAAGAALGAAPASTGSKIGFKLTGGLAYQSLSDTNANLVDGWYGMWQDIAKHRGTTLTGELTPLHWGPDVSLEATYQLTPRFGLSLGVGFLSALKSKDSNTMSMPDISRTFEDKLTAIPVTAGFVYSRGLTERLKVFAAAGVDMVFAKWTQTVEWLPIPAGPDSTTFIQQGSGAGLGFHGGVGFEVAVSPMISLVVEGVGRYAKIGNLQGDVNETSAAGKTLYSVAGKLYYYEYLHGSTNKWYPEVYVYSETDINSASDLRKVRDAQADFSGFSFRAGIKINL